MKMVVHADDTILNVTSMPLQSPIFPKYLNVWNSEDMAVYKYSVFALIMVISIFGNLVVILTYSLTKKLRSQTSSFIINMAVADLLVSFVCMPIHLFNWLDHTVMLDERTCKVLPFLQGTTVCCSVYTLSVIALDRYKSIIKPMGWRIRKSQCFRAILFIWLASMTTVSPALFVYRVEMNEDYGVKTCDEHGWSATNKIEFTYILIALTYVLPICLLSVVYARIVCFLWFRKVPGLKNLPICVQKKIRKKTNARKKSIRMLIIVLSTFVLCHTPQNIITFLWYTGDSLGWAPPMYIPIVSFHAELLLYMNSAINPLVYAIMYGQSPAALKYMLFRRKSDAPSPSVSTPIGNTV